MAGDGFKAAGYANRHISELDQSRSFSDVYGSGYAPDVSFFYEFQPFSGSFGAIGIISSVGMTSFRGVGMLSAQLPRPDGGTFSSVTQTKFQFLSFPVIAALVVRWNWLHYLRPYVLAGPIALPYFEGRNDNVTRKCSQSLSFISGFCGISQGVIFGAGTAILLDVFSPTDAWGFFENNGIIHSYLTIDAVRMMARPSSQGVTFAVDAIRIGFLFEY